jgi:RimJ/RimL family protein N-acetyltransferase
VLAGRLVTLRPWTPDGVTALLDGTDSGFDTVPGYPSPGSLDGLLAYQRTGGSAAGPGWSVVLKDEGQVAGDCWVKGWVDDSGAVEIAYAMARPVRGEGYGTDAVGVLVRWLVSQPDVGRVEAEVEPDNVASRRLLQRLGFTQTGDVRGRLWFAFPASAG